MICGNKLFPFAQQLLDYTKFNLNNRDILKLQNRITVYRIQKLQMNSLNFILRVTSSNTIDKENLL